MIDPSTTIHPDYLAALLGVVAQAQALIRHSRQHAAADEAAAGVDEMTRDLDGLAEEVAALAAWSADHVGGSR